MKTRNNEQKSYQKISQKWTQINGNSVKNKLKLNLKLTSNERLCMNTFFPLKIEFWPLYRIVTMSPTRITPIVSESQSLSVSLKCKRFKAIIGHIKTRRLSISTSLFFKRIKANRT